MLDNPRAVEQPKVIESEDRHVWPALARGWRRRCPKCGNGQLMKGYLKVSNACPVCREELFHHRADDGPAYLTILLVGHLMAPLLALPSAQIERGDRGVPVGETHVRFRRADLTPPAKEGLV